MISHPLEYIFHPESIAIVGVSKDRTKRSGGQIFLEPLHSSGFKGKIYPVGLESGEISGLKVYPGVKEVPDRIDYVISAIPARQTPQLIADCALKGVKTIHMFTAGFSEIGDEAERQLELQISALAHEQGIRIIGPNCMGLYYPGSGLSFSTYFPRQSGPVGFISQSGANCVYGVPAAAMRGIYFSKVINHGNGCDLNETDFLSYLTHDPETRIIALYLEGVKDGRHFFQALKEAARVKPIVVYKGGTTESGTRAAASHTGAIAGSAKVWGSLLRQAGAIQVWSMEELIDVLLPFALMSPPKGASVAVIGLGGGASVQAGDACANASLAVPPFPPEVRQKLTDICGSEAGGSFKNPLDIWAWFKGDLIKKAIELISHYNPIDLLMIHIPIYSLLREAEKVGVARIPHIKAILDLPEGTRKRAVIVLHCITSPQARQLASEVEFALAKTGFAVYPAVDRAANALGRFIQYHSRQSSRLDQE